MDVSVIIPAYNEAKGIEKTLRALRAQDPDEIIVVDNNSRDGTAKIAGKYADLLLSQKKHGAAASRNLGAARAKNSVIAFLDADCVPEKGWVEAVRKGFTGKTVGLTGPISPHGGRIKDRAAFFLSWSIMSRFFIGIRQPAFPGGNCAYDQKVFLEAGGFRTDVIPGEDIEMSRRIRKEGRLRYSGDMKVSTRTARYDEYGYLSEIGKWLRVFWSMGMKEGWKYPYPDLR